MIIICYLILIVMRSDQKSYLVNTRDEVRVSHGRVWHLGRIDQRLKILGAAVHPSEVESVISNYYYYIYYYIIIVVLIFF